MIHEDLIFDLGFHNGDDTAYYLERGYRVLAVDANPAVVDAGIQRFERAIAEGRLMLRNVGIAETADTLKFYVNEADSKLSSFDRSLAARHGRTSSIHLEKSSSTCSPKGVRVPLRKTLPDLGDPTMRYGRRRLR